MKQHACFEQRFLMPQVGRRCHTAELGLPNELNGTCACSGYTCSDSNCKRGWVPAFTNVPRIRIPLMLLLPRYCCRAILDPLCMRMPWLLHHLHIALDTESLVLLIECAQSATCNCKTITCYATVTKRSLNGKSCMQALLCK